MSVIVENHGLVTEVILGRPEVRNAMGPQEAAALRAALAAGEGSAAIVISALGDAFCAGGDLPAIVALAERGADAVRETIYGEFQALFRALRSAPAPIITAVDGPAIGFGCDLALAGSLTFIGARGWLAQGWAKAGLIPATGGVHYVQQRGGPQALWRLMIEDRVNGPLAETMGLAIACDNARQAALAAAAKLAALPQQPLRALGALSHVEEENAHLGAALDFQVGFITSDAFKVNAARLLQKRS